MAQFGLVITDAGLALQNRIQAGDTLTFKRVAVGAGYLPDGGTKEGRTALVSEKDSVSPAYATLVNGMATVEAQFSNSELAAAYTLREIGLFAQDPDNPAAEILYAYGNAGDNGDYMPAGAGADVITLVEKLVVAVGNASAVTAVLDDSAAYVTQQQWESHVGVGGLTQHPAVSASTSGFMTPAMKEKLDAVSPAYSVRLRPGDTPILGPPDFQDAISLGQISTIKGEILLAQHNLRVMYSINVHVTQEMEVYIPVPWNPDTPSIFIDGAAVLVSAHGIHWEATAGDHLVQIITWGSSSAITVGEWIDGVNVKFISPHSA